MLNSSQLNFRRKPSALLAREEISQALKQSIIKEIQHEQLASVRYALAAVGLDNVYTELKYKHAVQGPDKEHWLAAHADEIDRLINRTKTMEFIQKKDVPQGRIVSYYNPQTKMKIKEGKTVYRIRGTFGGNVCDLTGDTSAQTADLSTFKILLNAFASESAPSSGPHKAKLSTVDIVDYFLQSDVMPEAAYMFIHRDQLPPQTLLQFKDQLHFIHDKVYVRINKGIYGLPQAAKLAQDKLVKHLTSHGYIQTSTPYLFKHSDRNVFFTVVVDDFAVKYTHDADFEHFTNTLRATYDITVDIEGNKYLGFDIAHDKVSGNVRLSMPTYVSQALTTLNVEKKKRDTHAPATYIPPSYGKQVQQVQQDLSLPLDKVRIKRIQQICGIFLYYARALDHTMLTSISKIASAQAAPTEEIEKAADVFLQYAATHPVTSLLFKPSQMCLIIHSDASYLSETHSRSRAGGVHFLGNVGDSHLLDTNPPVALISKIIDTVCCSAHEAEYAAMFYNAHLAKDLRITLENLGYKQQPTNIIGDNDYACDVVNGKVQRRGKVMSRNYDWIIDIVREGFFKVIWKPGKDNRSDYFTKSHPLAHYKEMRSKVVSDFPISNDVLRGNQFRILSEN